MSFTQITPPWFFGFDMAFELFFGIIALVIAIAAFKIYKKTDQNQVKIFGISFLLIGISYFILALSNLIITSNADKTIWGAIKFESIALSNVLGMYLHILFMLIGLILLANIPLKTQNKRIFWLLLTTSFSAILLGINTWNIFYLLSSIYLFFISWHFVTNYLKNRQTKALLVAIAFVFLLIGNIEFIFAVNYYLAYVFAHIFEFFAYLLILANFYLVHKK